jgi:hypothetical protein
MTPLKRGPGRLRLMNRVETQRRCGCERAGRALRLGALLLAGAGLLAAQPRLHYSDYYPHHNFTFGMGDAQPRGDLEPYFVQKPLISIGYGYRFLRYLQADVGLDIVFGAAHVRDYLETDFGPLRIRDRQFFVPFGGRAILPLFSDRVQIFGGGGGAYMRYAELLRQPSSYFKIDCPVCLTRDGWGYYALAGASVFLDRGRHFSVGGLAKAYRGHTEGENLAGVPRRTMDHWLNALGQFGFSF